MKAFWSCYLVVAVMVWTVVFTTVKRAEPRASWFEREVVPIICGVLWPVAVGTVISIEVAQ